MPRSNSNPQSLFLKALPASLRPNLHRSLAALRSRFRIACAGACTYMFPALRAPPPRRRAIYLRCPPPPPLTTHASCLGLRARALWSHTCTSAALRHLQSSSFLITLYFLKHLKIIYTPYNTLLNLVNRNYF